MTAPAVIEPIVQKAMGDCVIACIAMILGVPYQEASKAALDVKPQPHSTGLTTREAQKIANKLVGHPFQIVNTKGADLDFDNETGILYVRMSRSYHAVILFEGVVVDPSDGLVWNLQTFLHTKKASTYKLLRP